MEKPVNWNEPLYEVDEENAVLKQPSRKKPKKFKKRNWNDVIGCVDEETGTFQKSLDDYMNKNPKGREDIPVTTRR